MIGKGKLFVFFVAALIAITANTATAATLYHGDTGSFDWAVGGPGWSAASGGPYTDVWVDGNAAFFNATSGTANITSVVNVSEVEATGTDATYYIQGGELNIADGGIISCYSGRTLHVSSVISGGGENGWKSPNSGDLYLEGDAANTYTGPVTWSGRTLYLGKTSGNALTGDVILNLGPLVSWSAAASLALNASEQIADTATINFTPRDGGYTTFVLNGNNETVGGISDLSGRAVIANALTSTGGVGTLTVNNADDCEFRGQIYNYSSGVDSSIALIKDGPATLTLSGSSNSYKGGLTVKGGTLRMGSANALGGAANAITVQSGGTIDVNGQAPIAYNNAATINGAGVGAGGALINSSATAGGSTDFAIALAGDSSVGGSGDLTLGNVDLSGGYDLTKVGDGKLTLAGTVLMDVNSGADSSQLLGGSGSLALNGPLNFDLNGVTAFGDWDVVASSLIASETYGDGFSVLFSLGGGTAAAVESSGVWSYSDITIGATVSFTEATGVLSVTAVPEPGTLAMLIAGLIGLAFYSCRKR